MNNIEPLLRVYRDGLPRGSILSTWLWIASIIVAACCSTPASAGESAALNLVFSCRADNDLYRVVTQSDRAYPRFDTPVEAIAGAPEGAGLLILADGYPQEKTKVNAAFFEAAAAKGQRLYVEYPAQVPGFGLKNPAYFATGPYGSVLERTVITSDAFRPRLDPMRILVINDCHYLPVAPRPEKVHMVLARVAGYDTAKLGLPLANAPILFELPDARAWVATTKLSQFASARYAPTEAWGQVWQTILQRLQPGKTVPTLKWTPAVRPRYTRVEPLPADARVQAIDWATRWYRQSRLLVAKDWWPDGPWDPNQNPGIQPLPARWSVGDGSLGIAECYLSKRVFQDGSQAFHPAVRADCTAESAMGLAVGAAVTKDASYETIAKNLNDFLWFRSVMAAQGPQADPQRPSYGMLGHNAASPGNTHYWGDDNARVLLGTIASTSLLRSDRWDEPMLRTMLANFRLTGPKGYHAGGLIPQGDLERNGWQHYWNWDGTDLSPHYQSYKWAVFLWLYDKTRFQPLLERTRTGIRLMMEAYPRGWSAECGRMEEERAHMLLPLAWLVRVEDTPEHRQWLETMARFIFDTMTPAGAIPQMVDRPYAANEQYGAGEAPIVYETGDPGTDLLYTMNFAFSGMHEAAAATGDTRYAEAAERMAKFLIRAQTQSEARPELSGTWFRAFDFGKWDYWGSDGDAGWGVWTTESGWTHSWITATLALRQMKTSLWEISQDRQIKPRFDALRREMLPDAALRQPARVRTDHAARGKPVQLAHGYHQAYTAGGPGALTDGKRGGTGIPLLNWQGFEGVDLEATVDLGQVTAIRSLSTTCLQNTPLGIYLPTEVKYLVSVDGRQFDVVATLAGDVGDQKAGPFMRAFSAELTNVSARHVRVQARSVHTIPAGHPAAGSKVWLFADEIMVNGALGETAPEAEPEEPGVYREGHRPQFHFTYRKGWLSDINGPVFYQGEYHLFTQHCPGGPALDYSRMHWGHAVSTDLVHWRELPLALAPGENDGVPGSGTALVDWKNTAGFQTGAEPPLVIVYTGCRYLIDKSKDGVICLAYSNDRGRTWTKYAGNPVLPAITHYNRDPKVFWHEPTRKWVMVITLSCADNWLLGRDGDYRFAIFSSPDLKQWKETSRFDMPRGVDCPDLFELPVDGKAGNRRWVFWAGDGTHAIGTFDGTRFDPLDGIRPPLVNWPDKGANGYAAQTFSDIPAADGRRIQIAWLRALEHGGYPGMPFNQQALFPVELTLRAVDGHIQLFREPVREVEQLHGRKWEWTQHTIRAGENLLSGIRGELFELRAEIEPGDASEISIRVRGASLRYDPTRKTLTCLDKTVPAGSADGKLRLQLLIDRTTLELFADRGRTSLSFFVAPGAEQTPLELMVAGGEAKVRSLTVWEMKSIWREDLRPPASNGVPRAATAADHSAPSTVSLTNSPFIFGAGGVGNSMDAMAFYHQGVWHLFHMQTHPRGIAHRVSRDLVNWEIRPLAIPGDAATGNVVIHQGQFHLFYTLNQTVHVATSDNLDDWTPSQRNPVATVDGKQYVGSNFRDPYVFYNEEESSWWMLVTAEVAGPIPFRAGCVGVYKSPNLLDWRAAEPLWAAGLGPRHECPQVIREKGRWYLFDIERQDQYRVAKSLAGPWLRPINPYLGPHTALAGSHLTSDGKRWVSFPFLCAQQGKDDFGEVVQAEVYAIPRQLDFHADGSITERPIQELIQAMHALAPVPPLSKTTTLSGSWNLKEQAAISAHTGTLLLSDVPSDCYFEADVTLETRHMEAAILLRADAGLTKGYRLELRPEESIVAFRPFSFWDRDRILISGHIDLPTGSPFKIRIFLSGTVVEAFIDDRLVLSTRVYRHPEGHVALAVSDGAAAFRNLVVRRLFGDNHEAEGRRP